MKDVRAKPATAGGPREAERRARSMRKKRDAAAILTVLGVVLFTSPLVSAIGSADGGGTVPLAVQYIFDIWAILIAAAFVLARVLPRAEDAQTAPSAEKTDHSSPSPTAPDTSNA